MSTEFKLAFANGVVPATSPPGPARLLLEHTQVPAG